MKEWIDFCLHEFDERLLLKIQKFANSKLSKVNNKVAEEIVEVINSKVLNFRGNCNEIAKTTEYKYRKTSGYRCKGISCCFELTLQLFEEILPSQFILDESPEIIANMMTFIESKLFYRIKVWV